MSRGGRRAGEIARTRLAAGMVLALALALADGCSDDVDTGGAESTTGAGGETTVGPEATTGGPAPGSTDTGRPTDTGMDTSGPGITEGSSSGDGTSSSGDGTSSSGDGTSSSSASSDEGTSSSSGPSTHGGSSSDGGPSPGGSSSSDGGPSTHGESSSESTSGGTDASSSSTDAGDTDTGDTDDTDTGETSECSFSESFDGIPDGSDWPAPWVPSGGVMLADVQGGRGRILPITGPYALGRMYVPLPPTCVDIEGTFTFELAEAQTPGVGLYLRHNGGFLDQTDPPGQGYVAFVQAFGMATGISFWRELDGVETVLAPYDPQLILADTVYRLRYRITQQDPVTTRLQARVWPVEGIEPAVWHADLTDASPSLQGVGGGFSVDVWSQLPAGVATDVLVDDIVIGPAP
jgi:hypothetical protein